MSARTVPHPGFAAALAALDAGDVERLRSLLAADPSLVHARTNLDPPYGYFTGATLLHLVAGNPGRDNPLPPNIVDVARLLLDAGADVHAQTLGPNGGDTMGLLVTGKQASDMGVTGALLDLLLEYGATLDVARDDALDGSLANHSPAVAERMIDLGARVDALAAAALGRMDWLRGFFDADGRLRWRPRRHGKDISNRANPFNSTPLSWAQHNKQTDVFDWMRAHCAIDLHDAVCLDFPEHIEARLREDPASINKRLDQWELRQCTPLHWAAWTQIEDVDGVHPLDPSRREALVEFLLKHGADPNIVAGNGATPLDVALAAQAPRIAALLERHGAKRAADL